MNNRFVFINRWRIAASREQVWALLMATKQWPRWWPQLLSVQEVRAGQADCIGATNLFRWKSGLGYHLDLIITTARATHLQEIEGNVSGTLRGKGLWLLEETGKQETVLTYRWDVELMQPWMRFLAPLLRPLFAANHFRIMRAGIRGMARELHCQWQDVEEWSGVLLAPRMLRSL